MMPFSFGQSFISEAFFVEKQMFGGADRLLFEKAAKLRLQQTLQRNFSGIT